MFCTLTDRDLKPDNIGFDHRGEVKLFDFGLAKELDDSILAGSSSDFYELTGNTGSLRYMAPEVALKVPYNLSADVYSFGLLLWQICSLALPYDGMNRAEYFEYVVQGSDRPTLDPTWSTLIRVLLKRSWDPSPSRRPVMSAVRQGIKSEISALRHDPHERKQTFAPLESQQLHKSLVTPSQQNSFANMFRSRNRISP
jgi:serine/threonine protein kinase